MTDLSPRVPSTSAPRRPLVLWSIALAWLAAVACATQPAHALDLVRDGEPAAVIVVPDDADGWTRTAADWVQQYVEQSTGARLAILAESQPRNGAAISVGHTQLARQAGIDAEGLAWDGCRLAVRDGVLFLLGRDETFGQPDSPSIPGAPPVRESAGGGAAHGTCRAAVTFLERFVGVRWLLPVRDGVVVPRLSTLAVPDDLDVTFNPAFAFLHGRYPYGENTPAAIANNYRTAVKVLSYGGHSYYGWLPAERYFDEHPEYFAMIGGKRVKQGNHLCSSNPQVRQILLDAIRRDFDAGWDWVALGQEDGYLRCQCPECEKLDDFNDFAPGGWGPWEGETWDEFVERNRKTPCERLLLLHKWIVDECAKSHPDKKVHMLLYGPTLFPSKLFDRLGDNVVGEVAFYHDRLDLDMLDLWKDKTHALTAMCTWFDMTGGGGLGMGVMMTPREVAKAIREYQDRNVIGLYGIHEANWGLQGISFYVQGKIAGDPTLDVDTLTAEYCDGLYGKAADAMKDFFDVLYSRSARRLGLHEMSGRILTNGEQHLVVYPPAFMHQLEPMLQRAETLAAKDSDRARRLVQLTRLHFDYLKLVTNMQAAYAAWQASETPEAFAQVKTCVDDFEAYRTRVLLNDDPDVTGLPGYEWLCKFLVGGGQDVNYYNSWERRRAELDLTNVRGLVAGFSASAIREPLTIDFDQATHQRPAARIVVRRVPVAPTLDGVIAGSEWGTSDPAPLTPITVGATEAGTTVRIVYDHENLYLAFECHEPLQDRMKLQAVGRDGNVWALDHVEAFFDPESSRRRRYQLMVAPHDDAAYDARIGFQSLDDEDVAWNGGWDYAFHLDPDQQKWTLEVRVPFASLGMETPNDGDAIRANFARARYVGGGPDPDCSRWSHGESISFSDPATFGTLVFEHILY